MCALQHLETLVLEGAFIPRLGVLRAVQLGLAMGQVPHAVCRIDHTDLAHRPVDGR